MNKGIAGRLLLLLLLVAILMIFAKANVDFVYTGF
jgi:hypothetical protein